MHFMSITDRCSITSAACDMRKEEVMNIQVQCCGIVVLALIWYFSLRQKPLGLASEKLFLLTMGVNSFCIIMDILSIIAINNMEHISGFLLALICKSFGSIDLSDIHILTYDVLHHKLVFFTKNVSLICIKQKYPA